jgi:Fe2+ or Zn2+ uptake regulation protein
VRHDEIIALLSRHGIQPSAQRVAVADYVLFTDEHPSADRVFGKVKKALPMLSRATVYNTLNVLVEKGLLRELVLAEGKIVFDPKLDRHHHFVDGSTGRIYDVPWEALEVKRHSPLDDYEVDEYQVVLRGRRLPKRR